MCGKKMLVTFRVAELARVQAVASCLNSGEFSYGWDFLPNVEKRVLTCFFPAA
jgi:hypothetical protein